MRRLLPTVVAATWGLVPLLAGCSTGGQKENSPALVEATQIESPEALARLTVKESLDLNLLNPVVSRTGYIPSQVEEVIKSANGIRVDAGGMSWQQRELIRIDHGPEIFSGALKIHPELSREIPTEILSAWVVSLTDEEFRSQVTYPPIVDGEENRNPRIDLGISLRKIPPRGDGPVVELVGTESGEYEVVESNLILEFLLSRYAVRFRVGGLQFEPVPGKRLPRVSDVDARDCLNVAPTRLQVQVIASTSGRWQSDVGEATPCLVWASDVDPHSLQIGGYAAGGWRRVAIPPAVYSQMLRWPVSEYQVLVRCEPEARGDWRVPEDLSPGKTVVIGTVARDRIVEAFSRVGSGSSERRR